MRKSGAWARSRPPLSPAVGHRPSELLLVIGKDVQFHYHHLFRDHHPLSVWFAQFEPSQNRVIECFAAADVISKNQDDGWWNCTCKKERKKDSQKCLNVRPYGMTTAATKPKVVMAKGKREQTFIFAVWFENTRLNTYTHIQISILINYLAIRKSKSAPRTAASSVCYMSQNVLDFFFPFRFV